MAHYNQALSRWTTKWKWWKTNRWKRMFTLWFQFTTRNKFDLVSKLHSNTNYEKKKSWSLEIQYQLKLGFLIPNNLKSPLFSLRPGLEIENNNYHKADSDLNFQQQFHETHSYSAGWIKIKISWIVCLMHFMCLHSKCVIQNKTWKRVEFLVFEFLMW